MEKMKDLIEEEVDNMLPQMAYKFVYEKMPKDAVEAIEKCLLIEGMTPEIIAGILVERYPSISDNIKRFFIKALEYHKFLIMVRQDLI